MREIPLLNGKGVALVDDEDYEALSRFKWHLSIGGYNRMSRGVTRSVRHAGKSSSVRMHRQILALPSEDHHVVDHINGNALDNRRANLRVCSQRQNLWNRKMKAGGGQTG